MAEKKLFNLHENEYYKKSKFDIDMLHCEKEFWNVDETISELSYLTHNYFRYYGKFPSKIGKMILEDLTENKIIDKNSDYVLDNYAGSGTTLVEAKLAGYDSVGFDINPFASLACRVKTNNYDVGELRNIWNKLQREIVDYDMIYKSGNLDLVFNNVDLTIKEQIDTDTERKINDPNFTKWFSETILRQLTIIKNLILSIEYSREREFFDLGFFAIIRRVSKAHDAEVRPHVNKKKRERDAIEAFSKKINEMLDTMEEWNIATDTNIYSNSYTLSNADEQSIAKVIEYETSVLGKNLGAIISHPPYLNCFDYIPVYKLKFMWGEGFEEIFKEMSLEEIKKGELKSYPVNNHKQIDRYFEHNYKVYKVAYDNLKDGGFCCIVIGDCTVKKELFSVHKVFIKMMEEIGFSLEKLVYRSTAYGMGRYAYNFRADYSEDRNGKQDAILFFKKSLDKN
ncbi:TPA: DNA methyltransferase [Streptococcus suis]